MTVEGAVVVGKVGKIYGSDGSLAVNLYDTFPEDFTMEEPLFVTIDGLTVPLFCESFTRRGTSKAVVRFADLDNEFRASEIVGMELALGGFDDSEDDDRLYFEDMEGWRVKVDGQGGILTSFIDGENPLFEIVLEDGREILVPAVDEFMVDINQQESSLELSLPEGLLDLY